MNEEKIQGGMNAAVHRIVSTAAAIFAVGAALASIGIISNNTVSATHHSVPAAIIAQQAYGANSKLL
jgi:hypothetical protein